MDVCEFTEVDEKYPNIEKDRWHNASIAIQDFKEKTIAVKTYSKQQAGENVSAISHLEKAFLKFRPFDIIPEPWGLWPTCKLGISQ